MVPVVIWAPRRRSCHGGGTDGAVLATNPDRRIVGFFTDRARPPPDGPLTVVKGDRGTASQPSSEPHASRSSARRRRDPASRRRLRWVRQMNGAATGGTLLHRRPHPFGHAACVSPPQAADPITCDPTSSGSQRHTITRGPHPHIRRIRRIRRTSRTRSRGHRPRTPNREAATIEFSTPTFR